MPLYQLRYPYPLPPIYHARPLGFIHKSGPSSAKLGLGAPLERQAPAWRISPLPGPVLIFKYTSLFKTVISPVHDGTTVSAPLVYKDERSAWERSLGSSGFLNDGKQELARPGSQAGAWKPANQQNGGHRRKIRRMDDGIVAKGGYGVYRIITVPFVPLSFRESTPLTLDRAYPWQQRAPNWL